MKLLLIKIGKAYSALKREGVFLGGKRVIISGVAFLKMLKPIKRGEILFIASGVGDSSLYRVYHIAEELELHGFKCSITVQDNPLLFLYAKKFKAFIFHRTLYTTSIAKFIDKIKKNNGEIIFETDDLIFDVKQLKHMDYLKNVNTFEKKLYENGVGGEILEDDYVKICTTSTKYLANILETYGKKVFVVSNKLSNADFKLTEDILKNKIIKNNNEVRMGYFSGTICHNKDFETIADALMEIMEKYPNTKLFLVGPLDIGSKLMKFGNRIVRLPRVARNEHFQNIAEVNINLAPLELDNPACESKSELKFFEAGILEVPTVAVRNQTFSEAINDGENGFLADNKNEWVNKLSMLIESRELRVEMGKKAREKALKDYTTKNSHDEEYYNYLKFTLLNTPNNRSPRSGI